MDQLKENIDKISKFGVVIFIVIIFLVFVYNHKSSQLNNNEILVPTVSKKENNNEILVVPKKENNNKILVAKVTKICEAIKKERPVHSTNEYIIINGSLYIKKKQINCNLLLEQNLEKEIEEYMKIDNFDKIINDIYNYLFFSCKKCNYINYYKNSQCENCNIEFNQKKLSDSLQLSTSPQVSTSPKVVPSFAESHMPIIVLPPSKKDEYLSNKTDIIINDKFWNDIFLPMYNIFIKINNKDLAKIFDKNPNDGTCSEINISEKTQIFLLECDYVFWKDSSKPSFISIKKKNKKQDYCDELTRFDNTVGISNPSYDPATRFILPSQIRIRYQTPNLEEDDTSTNKTSMDSQFKIPIYELYEKLVLKKIKSSGGSKDSIELQQTPYEEQDFEINKSKFWTNIFVPVYNAILQNKHLLLKKFDNSSTFEDNIYLLDCGYFFWKDISQPNCINFERYENSLRVSQTDKIYHVIEDQTEVIKINKQFKKPIIELYHKICKVYCIKCNNLANSNLTNCDICNYKIQEYCSKCGFLNQVIISFCNNCDKPFSKLYQGGFLLYYKNKKNYTRLNI